MSGEGRDLLEDKERWGNQTSFLSECHESRKRERINEDGSFKQHQKGPITSTYTTDWYHREGESRHKLGDWLKATSVSSNDQKRMLQAITHIFPSNVLIHGNTKRKESNKCDLCRALRIKENRFTSEADLPEQDLGHIQHTREALSEAHTVDHHRCWRLIHAELVRLASPEWRFMCITGEKNLETVWKELAEEFKADLDYMNITKDVIWNEARVREMGHPLTSAERELHEGDQSMESIVETRFWRLRPDGIAFRPHTKSTAGTFCILEFKRMSDCTD